MFLVFFYSKNSKGCSRKRISRPDLFS